MLASALLAHPWYAAALILAVYALGYGVALYAGRLYTAGARERIVYPEGYPPARKYAQAWGRGWPVNWRFGVLLAVIVVAIPLVGQIALERFGRPELFLAIVGGLVLVELAETLEHLRHIALFRQVLGGANVVGRIELTRRATLTVCYVELYGLAALFGLLALLEGSWFCAGGALGCVVAAQRWRDWVIVVA